MSQVTVLQLVCTLFQGLRSYYGLKRILLHKFAHFKGLRLFFLSNFPEATFIQGATSIPASRVVKNKMKISQYFLAFSEYMNFLKTKQLRSNSSQQLELELEKIIGI